MAERERVGFIGLGAMGARMAGNVLAAGYPLTVYKRNKDLWLTVAAAYERGASAPLAAAALETYSMAMTTHGDEDSARIAAYIDDVSG
jgi:3-hydroxyisobutyrate dehydrogenase